MSDIAISVQLLQKFYKLYAKPSDRLKEVLFPFGKKRHQDFYALKDITFSLPAGQSLGIIGRNGSGKSTLLKILAGVLTPSAGTAHVAGSIGSLLELGGGFNGELTGKDNAKVQMLLNDVGENEADILNKIVEFAELGDFIDQPVKKYSSGMFMRLAFACATVFSPQVLIIDEALAVGDAYFVKKCMNRMHELLAGGTTLLFVSHDIEAIRRLCTFSLLINQGKQLAFGSTPEVAEQYVALLRMQEQKHGKVVETFSDKEANLPLSEALFPAQGVLDLAEQRLFVSGCWEWLEDESTGLVARHANQPTSKAAFRGKGNRLSLSFLRGGGFELPLVLVDGRRFDVFLENDLPFFSPGMAPPQVRNFTKNLPEGDHAITIVVDRAPVAWLGGELSFTDTSHRLLFNESREWISTLNKRVTVYGDGNAVITYAELLDFYNRPITVVMSGDSVRFRIHVKRKGRVKNVSIGFKVHNRLSVGMFGTTTWEEQYALNDMATCWVVEFAFVVPLVGGEYSISAAVSSVSPSETTMHHYIDIAVLLSVQNHPRRSIWGEFHNPTQILIKED